MALADVLDSSLLFLSSVRHFHLAGLPSSTSSARLSPERAEAVIYSLIDAFVVLPALPEDKIEWRAAGTIFPVVRGEEDRGPQLPLKLRAI